MNISTITLLEQKDPKPIIGHAKSFPFIFIEDRFVNVKGSGPEVKN